MGQTEVLKVLKKHKGQKLSARDIAQAMPQNNSCTIFVSLKKLRENGTINSEMRFNGPFKFWVYWLGGKKMEENKVIPLIIKDPISDTKKSFQEYFKDTERLLQEANHNAEDLDKCLYNVLLHCEGLSLFGLAYFDTYERKKNVLNMVAKLNKTIKKLKVVKI
ncbi:MAG: hypothetical protein ACTSPO_15915 [Candidatus Heimdallarchaeaceae archaeon]